jgi:hypothetical protein
MEILSLNKKFAEIQVLLDELKLLQSALSAVIEQFPVSDFQVLLLGLSQQDAILVLSALSDFVRSSPKSPICVESLLSITPIDQVSNGYKLHANYQTLLFFCSSLNEITHGMHAEILQQKLRFPVSLIAEILDELYENVISWMNDQQFSKQIYLKRGQIENELNFKREYLEWQASDPQFSKLCTLRLSEHQLSFRLLSCQKRKVFSGLELSCLSNNKVCIPVAKHTIKNHNLIELISYLDVAISELTPTTDLMEYSFSMASAKYREIVHIRTVSRHLQQCSTILVRLMISQPLDEDPTSEWGNWVIEDVLNVQDVRAFIQSVKIFLSNLLPQRFRVY